MNELFNINKYADDREKTFFTNYLLYTLRLCQQHHLLFLTEFGTKRGFVRRSHSKLEKCVPSHSF